MRDVSYRVALGGIVASLCLIAMFLAGILPAFYLILPMIAGLLMMIIATEVSTSWALLTYIAVGLLSLLITADKEAALIFIMLFGHYPILRFYLQKMHFKAVRFLIKIIIFNICVLSFFYITVYIFGIREMIEQFDEFGKYGGLIMLSVCNIIFVLYDYNLGMFWYLYKKHLMPKFKRKK
ncbi:MAG: hypothetical protein IKS03_10840 [Ruminococcus sp.]|nr:hypothetical protein [Ruminococcus sp.]